MTFDFEGSRKVRSKENFGKVGRGEATRKSLMMMMIEGLIGFEGTIFRTTLTLIFQQQKSVIGRL